MSQFFNDLAESLNQAVEMRQRKRTLMTTLGTFPAPTYTIGPKKQQQTIIQECTEDTKNETDNN